MQIRHLSRAALTQSTQDSHSRWRNDRHAVYNREPSSAHPFTSLACLSFATTWPAREAHALRCLSMWNVWSVCEPVDACSRAPAAVLPVKLPGTDRAWWRVAAASSSSSPGLRGKCWNWQRRGMGANPRGAGQRDELCHRRCQKKKTSSVPYLEETTP